MMREFAEEEIVIPDGPYAGSKFSCETQPYSALWFDAVDSGRWNRLAAVGPTQSGKTLTIFLVALLYHLFELNETVVCGVTDGEMAKNKWTETIQPVIARTRYGELLPTSGAGARGGQGGLTIKLAHGPVLRFMTGGGGDKSRASFSTRVVVVTETDGMDTISGRSREGDRISQLEGRLMSWKGPQRRTYLECTASIPTGRIWKEYQSGTCSQIMLRCPHCGRWVAPEREHLRGWQDAGDLMEARSLAHFVCPDADCGLPWSEADRRAAHEGAKLLHRGQSIEESGEITGDPPHTNTLGFRWSAVHNFMAEAADFGEAEWKRLRDPDEVGSERSVRQQIWAVPAVEQQEAEIRLHQDLLCRRISGTPRGQVPAGTDFLTAAVDLGQRLLHWMVVAWRTGSGRGSVVDFGALEVASDAIGVERALVVAQSEVYDRLFGPAIATTHPWPSADGGEGMTPLVAFVDARWHGETVYAVAREKGRVWQPYFGYGVGQWNIGSYRRPRKVSEGIRMVGEGYHVIRLPSEGLNRLEIDGDHWKTIIHERLAQPQDVEGALDFFAAPPNELLPLSRHLTAEEKRGEFVSGKGWVARWFALRRANHWFDNLYAATAAAHYCGLRVTREPAPPPLVAPVAPITPRDSPRMTPAGILRP